jgi:hypothetical protein
LAATARCVGGSASRMPILHRHRWRRCLRSAFRATQVRRRRGDEARRRGKAGLGPVRGSDSLATALLHPYCEEADCDRRGVAPAGRPTHQPPRRSAAVPQRKEGELSTTLLVSLIPFVDLRSSDGGLGATVPTVVEIVSTAEPRGHASTPAAGKRESGSLRAGCAQNRVFFSASGPR